jgi:NADH dehydrogenase
MRVAVFGAGYAGVVATRELEDRLPEDVDVVLVDDTGEHLVQHEVHRVVRRPGLAEDITLPLEEVVDRAEVREATVEALDPAAGVATLSDGGDELRYDAGVVALGAETAFYDLPGVEEHATPLKSVAHARRIREEFLAAVERGGRDRAVVGGAGLSGIQVAGELAALAREEGVDPEIVLLEMADEVAPTFPTNFQDAVRKELAARDVEVHTGRRVEEATDSAVHTDRGTVEYDQFVWTGGIRGDAAVGTDRPHVGHDLRVAGPTFGAGDAVRVVDREGQAVPDSSQTAIRQAPVAAENVARLVDHERSGGDGFEPRLSSYTYTSLGWIVSVGNGAVAQVGPTVWTGRPAKALKTSVGAGYLSNIGAVRNAVDLVNEELGIAADVGAETPETEAE